MGFRPHHCINPDCTSHQVKKAKFHKNGRFYIKRLNIYVTRFQCSSCRRVMSSRTFKLDYRHKKMDLNYKLAKLLVEGASLRSASRILGLTYKNTYQKFLWLKRIVEDKKKLIQYKETDIQFDELETIHHTKCKPLSITVVTSKQYLLALQVAEIPAKGHLAKISRQKYGERKDERQQGIESALSFVKSKLKTAPIMIKSDASPIYKNIVERVFPQSLYEQYNRAQDIERLRSKIHENNHKKRFDPLFDVNHACALLRSQIKRLTRRSWCTTKKVENLQLHLDLFVVMQFVEKF